MVSPTLGPIDTLAVRADQTGRGIYRLPGNHGSEHESLVTIATKVPHAVFCLLTALQFHELTTQLPRQIWIAMPRGSHTPKIDYPPVKMVQFTGDAYSAGIEEVERDGVRLRVYSVAKTVADCFKHRNKIGLDVALEALKDAIQELWAPTFNSTQEFRVFENQEGDMLHVVFYQNGIQSAIPEDWVDREMAFGAPGVNEEILRLIGDRIPVRLPGYGWGRIQVQFSDV